MADFSDTGIGRVVHEAFIQGFVAAKDPKNAHETLLLLDQAEKAYEAWRKTRTVRR